MAVTLPAASPFFVTDRYRHHLVPAAFVLAPRREMAWSNSVAYGAGATGPVVRMNAEAAAASSNRAKRTLIAGSRYFFCAELMS